MHGRGSINSTIVTRTHHAPSSLDPPPELRSLYRHQPLLRQAMSQPALARERRIALICVPPPLVIVDGVGAGLRENTGRERRGRRERREQQGVVMARSRTDVPSQNGKGTPAKCVSLFG